MVATEETAHNHGRGPGEGGSGGRRSQHAAGRRHSGLIVLGLGTNVGPGRELLREALDAIETRLGAVAVASLYRTAPVSPIEQPDFLNTVAVAEFDVEPPDPWSLLDFVKDLERDAGRGPGPRWGPRTLDVDLLLVGDLRLDDPRLTLPHPRMRERAFVLAPLADVARDLRIPPDGRTVAELLADVDPDQRVERVGW